MKALFGVAQIGRDGKNIDTKCPNKTCETIFSKKQKLSIRANDLSFHCWVCGLSGRGIDALERISHKRLYDELRGLVPKKNHHLDDSNSLNQEDISLPRSFTMLGPVIDNIIDFDNSFVSVAKNALSYLHERMVSREHIWYFKLGIACENRTFGRIIMPSFDTHGSLNFFVMRSFMNKKPKYINSSNEKNSIVFNELLIDWNEMLTIVEGPFDLFRCPKNTTCLLGNELMIESALFQTIVKNQTPITLFLDNDAKKKTVTAAKKLSARGCDVFIAMPVDGKDPGSMTSDEIDRSLSEKTRWDQIIAQHKLLVR